MGKFSFKVAYTTDSSKIEPAIQNDIIDEGDLVIVNENNKGSMKFITNEKKVLDFTSELDQTAKDEIIQTVTEEVIQSAGDEITQSVKDEVSSSLLDEVADQYVSKEDEIPISKITSDEDSITILNGGTNISETNSSEGEILSYAELINAIADPDVTEITLGTDINPTTPLVISGKNMTLDLNGHTIKNIEDIWGGNNWSLISIEDGGLTLIGIGTLDCKPDDCYAIDLRDNATLVISGDITVNSNISAVYIKGENAKCFLSNGTYKIQQLNDNNVESPYGLTINMYNAVREYSKCIISGGKYYKYDPANPEEGDVTYLRTGYTTVLEDDYYNVVKEG